MGAYGSPDLYPYDKMERRCPKCGRVVTGKYCPECGAKIGITQKKNSGCLKAFIICIIIVLGLLVLASIGSKSGKTAVDTSQFTQMAIGDVVSDGTVEYTLNTVYTTGQITSDWSDVERTYKPSGDNSLIIMELNMKNISNENVKCIDHIVAQALYDNSSYKYNGKWVIKDKTSGFLTDAEAELMPLETKTIIIAFEVPQEVCDSDKTLEVIFGSQDKIVAYKIR